MEYRMNVQCQDRISGQTGCFIADTNHEAISPVFNDLLGLYPWMHENGWKTDEYPDSKPGTFVPWRVVRTA